jgi:crossover junction endodeoxyribonuclease RuvC
MIVAIDPGASGAVAFLSSDGALQRVVDMPTVKIGTKTRIASQGLALLIGAARPTHAYVEQVGAMPGQGVSSMFAFGHCAGVIEGVLSACAVPTTFITPQQWKKAMQVTADKGSSRRRAMQLAPGLASDFQRVKDDGRAEAFLIGVYGLKRGAA